MQLPYQLFALFRGALRVGDVARHRVDHGLSRIGRGVPVEPAESPVLAQIAVLETKGLPARSDVRVLLEGARAIVGMNGFDERPRHQLFACEAQRSLPRPIQQLEVTAEIKKAEEVDRDFEKPVIQKRNLFLTFPNSMLEKHP